MFDLLKTWFAKDKKPRRDNNRARGCVCPIHGDQSCDCLPVAPVQDVADPSRRWFIGVGIATGVGIGLGLVKPQALALPGDKISNQYKFVLGRQALKIKPTETFEVRIKMPDAVLRPHPQPLYDTECFRPASASESAWFEMPENGVLLVKKVREVKVSDLGSPYKKVPLGRIPTRGEALSFYDAFEKTFLGG